MNAGWNKMLKRIFRNFFWTSTLIENTVKWGYFEKLAELRVTKVSTMMDLLNLDIKTAMLVTWFNSALSTRLPTSLFVLRD